MQKTFFSVPLLTAQVGTDIVCTVGKNGSTVLPGALRQNSKQQPNIEQVSVKIANITLQPLALQYNTIVFNADLTHIL